MILDISDTTIVHPKMNVLLFPILADKNDDKVQNNSWEGIEVKNDNMGGNGVFATKDIAHGTVVCHYGGKLLDLPMANKDIERMETKFLLEFAINGKPFFFNHYPNSQASFGKMLNHSKYHGNLTKKMYQDKHGHPVLMLVANRLIEKGEELTHDYGKKYGLSAECTVNCNKCKSRGKEHH